MSQTPPPPYGGPPPWQPHPGWTPPTPPPPTHPQATTALVLGILSIVGTPFCGITVLLGPVAWVLGARAKREIDQDPLRWGGSTEAAVGFALGIAATVLLICAVLLFVAFIVFAVTPLAIIGLQN